MMKQRIQVLPILVAAAFVLILAVACNDSDSKKEDQSTVNFLIDAYLDNSFLSRLDNGLESFYLGLSAATVFHETRGYYEILLDDVAYDVDAGQVWTAGMLENNTDPSDLYSWPNVINLTRLKSENQTLLDILLTALAQYDLTGAVFLK